MNEQITPIAEVVSKFNSVEKIKKESGLDELGRKFFDLQAAVDYKRATLNCIVYATGGSERKDFPSEDIKMALHAEWEALNTLLNDFIKAKEQYERAADQLLGQVAENRGEIL